MWVTGCAISRRNCLAEVIATSVERLERLSLMNIEVDDDDFAAPFSAPNLRDLWLFNCGPQSLAVAELFFREGLAADLPLASCQHRKFEHVPGFGHKAGGIVSVPLPLPDAHVHNPWSLVEQ